VAVEIIRYQLRRGTAAEWAQANPVLADGEPGYERDTGKQKIGDGVRTWTALPYTATKGDPGPAGVADDNSMAAIAADPDSEFRAVQNATLGAQIDATVPAAVADVISTDPTVATNAAALAQSDAGLARKTDAGVPLTIDTDRDADYVAATVDLAGNVTEAINKAGIRVLPRADLAGALFEQYASDEYLKGSVDAAGNMAEDVLDNSGRVPAWVLAEWQKRMGVGDAAYPYDIVIVAGQSNATKRGTSPVAVSEADSRITQWNYLTGKIEVVPETDVQWLGNEFAREYVRRVPNKRVLIVPVAWGETGFRTTSLASPPAGYVTKPNGTWDRSLTSDPKNLYSQMISKTLAAKIAAGSGSRIIGMLWSQGESDRGLMTQAQYAAAIDDLITTARADLAIPTLPVVIGSMIPETINYGPTNYYDITKALLDTPRRVQSTSYVWGPANYAEYPELIHWNGPGQSVRGKVMATDGIYRAKLNVATAAPMQPQGLRISRSATAVEIKWDAPPTRVTSYTLEVSTDSGATWAPQTLGGPIVTEHAQTIATNLPVWARIKTTNEVGSSDWSREAKA
jgi:hypothetical protein